MAKDLAQFDKVRRSELYFGLYRVCNSGRRLSKLRVLSTKRALHFSADCCHAGQVQDRSGRRFAGVIFRGAVLGLLTPTPPIGAGVGRHVRGCQGAAQA